MSQRGELILETRKLTKHFGPTVALNAVDFKIYRGQITGLIGENGSGKSTITSIAAGMQPPTSGEMFFKGQPHKPSSMIEGIECGIGMIVQEQGTVPGITVAENIFLGEEKKFGKVLISRRKMQAEAKKVLENIGLTNVDPAAPIESLNMQDRKLVEIAKTVYMKPEMLVVCRSCFTELQLRSWPMNTMAVVPPPSRLMPSCTPWASMLLASQVRYTPLESLVRPFTTSR